MRTRPHSTFLGPAVYSPAFLLRRDGRAGRGRPRGRSSSWGTGRAPAGRRRADRLPAGRRHLPRLRGDPAREPALRRTNPGVPQLGAGGRDPGDADRALPAPGRARSLALRPPRLRRLRPGRRRLPARARGGRLLPDWRFRRVLGLGRRRQHRPRELGARQGLRDGGTVGFIPALREKSEGGLAPTGRVFVPDAASLVRWSGWWRIVQLEQWGIFFVGAHARHGPPRPPLFSVIPPGTNLAGLAVAMEPARALSRTASVLGPIVARDQRVDPVQDPARHLRRDGPLP